MTQKYLLREDAPLEARVWDLLDKTMLEAAKSILTGRRLLYVEGPYGLGLKVVPLADMEAGEAPLISPVLPLAYIQRFFTLSKRDLASFERDGIILDTGELARAAIAAAVEEDTLIFRGTREIPGLMNTKGTSKLTLGAWDQAGSAAEDIIRGVTLLDAAGFHGPYALALAPARYNLLLRRFPNALATELEHVRTVVTEGVFKAPAIEAGGVLVATGRQFMSLVLGQDMSIGFVGPVRERLEFSLSESLALLVRVPQAVCVIKE